MLRYFYVQANNAVAMLRKTSSDNASTIVVINGLAITAGSNPKRDANIGRKHPTSLAISTTTNNVRQTTAEVAIGTP